MAAADTRPSNSEPCERVSSRTSACEGSVACSTCHAIILPEICDLLPGPSDDENDMPDPGRDLTDASRPD
ncbi:hypothetical protein PAXINDRAFT_85024 [Paxillus involutus ATCC 200175]|uniref:Uncharacterized protein n=1 Tax=Paxillus involutus ATCC 200175 TaxID=664439 RepID=A0A0C9SSC4_PAXIN|nr:hypothetical protein PAXINDRAFT_85024 [Paxillus involutus ATCC 200175]